MEMVRSWVWLALRLTRIPSLVVTRDGQARIEQVQYTLSSLRLLIFNKSKIEPKDARITVYNVEHWIYTAINYFKIKNQTVLLYLQQICGHQ